MFRIDVRKAYRLLPLAVEDRPLCGISFEGEYYLDLATPFGLRSAARSFELFATFLNWILKGVCDTIHLYSYDDPLGFAASEEEAKQQMSRVIATCNQLGVPLAVEKSVGPSTQLTFLGLQIDTVASSISLPRDKAVKIRDNLIRLTTKRTVNQIELRSLLGKLAFAIKAIPWGRHFLFRAYRFCAAFKDPKSKILAS